MILKDYMFKKRYFHYICSLPVDKDELIKGLRDNNRYVVLLKENDNRIVVFDTFQNNDIDFIGVVSSIENETEINGYFSHKVSLIEWIGYFFCIVVFWIWFFRNFTFSMSNLLFLIAIAFITLFLFATFPLISFISYMKPLRQFEKKYYREQRRKR